MKIGITIKLYRLIWQQSRKSTYIYIQKGKDCKLKNTRSPKILPIECPEKCLWNVIHLTQLEIYPKMGRTTYSSMELTMEESLGDKLRLNA